MKKKLLKNCLLINEGSRKECDVLIEGGRIARIDASISDDNAEILNLHGKWLMPGVIDDQVHFREPGLTHKAKIFTESRAAVAGGTTSFMEMPNTKPPALSQDVLENKYHVGSETSLANYSFFMGTSNDNIEEVLKTDGSKVCGVKIFMGSSTGNMLVDDERTLNEVFSKCPLLIALHCEDEATIKANTQKAIEQFGMDIPMLQHPIIRSREACYLSSSTAASMARKHGTRIHILHLTSAEELELFDNNIPLRDKKITSEVCVHHLTFSSEDYKTLGSRIKCNPAIKDPSDRDALWSALLDDRLDVVATDHAPHTAEEKDNPYLKAPSGLPLVQHSLQAMLEHAADGKITVERMVEKMCHAPAELFRILDRGYVREGYWADLVVVDPNRPQTVSSDNILYKCGWSPFEGRTFSHSIAHTFVSGHHAFGNGKFNEAQMGQRLLFDRD